MSTRTSCLDQRFRPLAESLLAFARRFGPYHFTSTCRTEAEQQWLWAHRGTNPFPVAPPGRSMHQAGLAVDMARDDIDPKRDLVLHLIGAKWREADPRGRLVWGESDPIHFEYRYWR